MIDLTFKVVAILLFIMGGYLHFASKGTIPEAALMMISGVFIFLLAQVICELRGIKEKLDKKS
jgi:hypothetical protein